MRKQIVVSGLIVLLVCVGFLSGCTNGIGRDNRFVGTWKSTKLSYDAFTCFSDGTFSAGAGILTGSGTWEIKDGKFVLSIAGGQVLYAFNYVFSDNDETLTLTSVSGGEPSVYTKQ